MSRSFHRRGPIAVTLTFAAIACAAFPIAAQRRVVGAIDDSQRVTLAGNTRPEAIPENDLGEVEDSLPLEHMQLLLRRSEKMQSELDAYTESLAERSSPNYHRWLTAAAFGARFGVDRGDIDTVTGWLTDHGFTVHSVYPNRMNIDFSGTAAEVREAFHTEIHAYEAGGARHIANDRDPQIPAALAPVITGIVSLNDFRPHRMVRPRPNYTYDGGSHAVTPSDLATIYDLAKLFKAGITGKGETIAVLEDSDLYSPADWTKFRSAFGLSAYTSGSLKITHPAPPSGSNNCADPHVDSDDGEATLDAEYASAAAPNATIEVAACNNIGILFGVQIALQNLLNESKTPPAVISISYGECESEMGASSNAAINTLYQQAVNEGVSVFVSAGDENAASCDVAPSGPAIAATHGIAISGYASTVHNVAVGGTDFADGYLNDGSTYWKSTNSSTFGSAKSYIPEIPWNGSCASVLLAEATAGSAVTYGKTGFCNSSAADEDGDLQVSGGSGGPSGCATGKPSVFDVTSGTCEGYAKPSWQALVGVPADKVRDIPDVSLFASNGVWDEYYVYCLTDENQGGAPCTGAPSNWAGAGGTSFSSPIMAGIQALVNEKTGKRWGNPNLIYYAIARSEYGSAGNPSCSSMKGAATAPSCVFYDVTLGDMDTDCTGTHDCYRPSGKYGVLSTSDTGYKPAFKATTGWDFATGIGTVNAYNLVFSNKW